MQAPPLMSLGCKKPRCENVIEKTGRKLSADSRLCQFQVKVPNPNSQNSPSSPLESGHLGDRAGSGRFDLEDLCCGEADNMKVEPLQLSVDLVPPVGGGEKQSVGKIITLTNFGEERVAFKIRTTARDRYSTTPNCGLLEAGEEIDVVVTMAPLSQEKFDSFSANMSACQDKLLVRSSIVDEHVKADTVRGEGAAEWWNSLSQDSIVDQVITCSFVAQSTKMQVAQSKLRFIRERSQGRMVGSSYVLAEEIVHIINNTSTKQAFKIRTTARDKYRVEPSCGVVDRGHTCPVRVSMVQPHSGTNDKFQVRCVTVDPGTDFKDVRSNEWWNETEVRARLYDTTIDSTLIDLIAGEGGAAGEGLMPAKIEAPLSLAPSHGGSEGTHGEGGLVPSTASEGTYDHLFKIVLIGDSNVGKTSLLTRFSDDTYTDSFIATIGVDFRVRTISLQGKTIKLQIWDTAGQERFRTITSAYYRGADGIVIVYDITSKESFDNVDLWLAEIAKYTQHDSVCKLVLGNKVDLAASRSVQQSTAQEFCSSKGIKLVETSAKTATRVDLAFSNMVSEILDQKAKEVGQGGASGSKAEKPSGSVPETAYVADQGDDGCCSCFKSIKSLFSDEPSKGYSKY